MQAGGTATALRKAIAAAQAAAANGRRTAACWRRRCAALDALEAAKHCQLLARLGVQISTSPPGTVTAAHSAIWSATCTLPPSCRRGSGELTFACTTATAALRANCRLSLQMSQMCANLQVLQISVCHHEFGGQTSPAKLREHGRRPLRRGTREVVRG